MPSAPFTPPPAQPADRWSAGVRLIVSAVVGLYLLVVVVPPLAGPPPSSGLARTMLQPLRPLVGSLHLGHGYRFFAPDPGPGHSIRWTATLPDGSERTGLIPDRTADWPRLLYHRRFMVSEKIAAQVPPPDAPEEVRDEARRTWVPLVKGVARRLLDDHDGEQVQLTLVQHFLPGPEEVLAGTVEPDDRSPLGSFARSTAVGKVVPVVSGPDVPDTAAGVEGIAQGEVAR